MFGSMAAPAYAICKRDTRLQIKRNDVRFIKHIPTCYKRKRQKNKFNKISTVSFLNNISVYEIDFFCCINVFLKKQKNFLRKICLGCPKDFFLQINTKTVFAVKKLNTKIVEFQ